MLTLVLGAGPAWAGYYEVTYSGGQVTRTSSSSTTPSSYPYWFNPNDDGYGVSYSYASWETTTGPNGNEVATSGSLHCHGAITATFTWRPSGSYGGGGTVEEDLPPRAVVIKEACSASWNSNSNPGARPTGSSSNGLGFGAVAYGPNITSTNVGEGSTSQGTRYKIQEDPGDSFTITCSPDVVVSGTGAVGPPSASGWANGYVNYKASAAPLEVVLSGGIGSKAAKKCLIGQKMTATFIPGGLPPSSYNWSVSGGSPFKSYTANDDTATFTAMNFASETGSSLTFHFKEPTEPNKATITCTAILQTPQGSLPTSPLNVTISAEVVVKAPDASFQVEVGEVRLHPTQSPTEIRVDGATLPGANGTAGSVWAGSVTTPSGFGSGGGWNYTQVVEPYRILQTAQSRYRWSYNGQLGLDKQFGADPAPGQLHPADGSRHVSGDTPGQSLIASEPLTYSEAGDAFVIYILYRPPGDGSTYVPLRAAVWFWRGQASADPSGGWTLSNTDSGRIYHGDFPDHPEWSHNNARGFWQVDS